MNDNKNDNDKLLPTTESQRIILKHSYSDNYQQIPKQLLFCSLAVIQDALTVFKTFSICYKWINENYLKKYIRKKQKEEK